MNQLFERMLTFFWKVFTRTRSMPWIFTVSWMALIFIGSRITFDDDPSPFTYSDKLAHFIEYGVLGFLLYMAHYATYPRQSVVKRIVLSTLFTFLYGVTDEIHQLFVPTREFSLYDLMADASGGIFFSCIAAHIQQIYLTGNSNHSVHKR